MQDQILKALNWRYATKGFDKTKKIPTEQLNALLEVLHLAPSSLGVQPWKFVVVQNPELRAKIQPVAYNQPQITDASDLVVFCARTDVNENFVDTVLANAAQTRNQNVADLAGFKGMIMGTIAGKKATNEMHAWNTQQVYIALGMLLESAALMEIDACPMEGFDPQKVNEVLGLAEKNLSAVAICTLGYRSSEDKYALAPKARLPLEEVIVRM